MIGGEVPFCVKIWRMLIHPLAKSRLSIYLPRSASVVTPSVIPVRVFQLQLQLKLLIFLFFSYS